ncbi:MAG: MMPL family transporter [Bacteroidales bacterium]|nr:MMPL family transporter [Bacteroidales bacterium]HOY37950.1 MMPL family transporter [Bacteroidales bacterium]HQP03193.1 MMPL family transporter [Bacteroidales bacterium]
MFWTKIAGFILRNRLPLLIAITAITGVMIWQTTRVRMDYHYANLLSEKDPIYLDNKEFKATFGEEANAIFIGIKDEKFFEAGHFNNFTRLCNDLKKIPNVKSVLSIPQAVNIRQITVETGDSKKRQFEIYPLFSDSTYTQQQLDSLKTVFMNLPFYNGLLYNHEKHVFLLSVSLKNEILDSPLRIPAVKQIEKTVEEYSTANNIPVFISGHPFIRTKLMTMIRSEIKIFIVLAALISAIILFLFFRNIKIILISIVVVGTAVVWATGLMGLFHYKITVLTSMIPPLLIVIGIPNIIYLLNKYHTEVRANKNKILALQRAIRRKGTAVFLSNLTTAVGFATFIITNSRILWEFGLIASLGVLFSFVLSLIVIPVVSSYLPVPSEKYTRHLDNKITTWVIRKAELITNSHRKPLYIIIASVMLLSVLGIINIRQTGYLMDDVPHKKKMYVDLKYLESCFHGVSPLEIMIKTQDTLSGNQFITQIQKIDSLQISLLKHKELSRSVSVADALKFLNQAYSQGKSVAYRLPDNPKTYETIFKRLPQKFDFNNQFIASFIDSSKTITRVSLNVEDVGTKKMKVLIPFIKKEVDQIFPPEKYHTVITGSTILYFTGTTYLTKNLFSSLSLAFIVIAVLLYWMFRSVRMTLLGLIPNMIPMILTAAIMGAFNIPLKPSTIMVFGIAFGISVDGTIHFVNKFRYEYIALNKKIGVAVNEAIQEVGISLVYNATILILGFSIFIVSGFGGTKALGILVSIALFASMICNLLLLPSLLLSLEKFYDRKTIGSVGIDAYDEETLSETNIN